MTANAVRQSQKAADAAVATQVLAFLKQDFDTSFALRFMEEASESHFYIFGGAVRNIAAGMRRVVDLDVMVDNSDNRIFNALDRLSVPFCLNSQGHRRYKWNRLQIDIFEPKDFFVGFPSVEQALSFFDLRINALAIQVDTQELIDPISGLACLNNSEVGINWHRWNNSSTEESLVLLIRLARILTDIPKLCLSKYEVDTLEKCILPKVYDQSWHTVHNRFPLGKTEFFSFFEDLISKRTLAG